MKNIKLLLQKITTMLMRNMILVHAEEPTVPPAEPPVATPGATAPPAPQINFETLIASARKEEKDKLYPQINTLKLDKEALTTRVNELLLSLGEKDAKITELTKALKVAESGRTDPEEVKTLKASVTDLTAQNAQLTAELQSLKLAGFKAGEIAKANGEILPELVTGATEDEILASIEVAKAKYKEVADRIKAQVGGASTTTVVPTAPVANPSAQNTQLNMSNITANDISKMSREQYAEYRKQIGLKR